MPGCLALCQCTLLAVQSDGAGGPVPGLVVLAAWCRWPETLAPRISFGKAGLSPVPAPGARPPVCHLR